MADAQVVMLVPLAGSGARPDQGLPGSGYPSHPIAGGGYPDQGLPGGGGVPSHPIAGYPDQGLPGGGEVGSPEHPIVVPPMPPPVVSHPIPPAVWPGVPIHPGTPEHPIEMPPGTVWPPLPPSVTGTALCLVLVLGVGYRWIVIEAKPQPVS